MKKLFITCLFFIAAFISAAQQPDAKSGTVYGKLFDDMLNIPAAYVTVSIKDKDAKLITAGISDEKGSFVLDGIPAGSFSIEFSLIGYEKLTRTLQINASGSRLNLGTLILHADTTQIKEVTITAANPGISLRLDKKVFEPGKDILSQSGSVNDMLNNVPSVSVGPSGSVSLRGNSNVLILIDGRRSGLTQSGSLDQIPADRIERVEVIANPSSRYDASGSAGIINIILKKNKKDGFNGQVRLAGGSPNDSRINPSLNYKSEKINLFSTLGIRSSDYTGFYATDQVTSGNDKNLLLNQVQHEDRHDDGKLLYLGADYFINDKNTITTAFLINATRDHDKTDLNYEYNRSGALTDSSLIRKGESWEKRTYNQLEFNYTRTFKHAAKKLTADLQYDFWNSDKDWLLATEKILPETAKLPGIRTSSLGASEDLLLQTDLVQPLSDRFTLEAGIKAENRSVTTDFRAEQERNTEWLVFDNIDNNLKYRETIGSAYVQLGTKLNKFTSLAGLRTELTRIRISDQKNTYSDRNKYNRLFPTFNLSYNFNERSALQMNYSKRINRPSLYLLYPFNELTDFNSQYAGNPDLNPSYADVLELGFLKNLKTLTFNPSFYYQYNKGFIQDYTFRQENGIFITSPTNIDSEERFGFELSLIYKPLNAIQINAELNTYSFSQKGRYRDLDLDFSGKMLTARISSQLRLPARFSFQGRYNFNAAQRNAQRTTASVNYTDLGISKNLMKEKVSLVADVTNVFNSRQYRSQTTGNDYEFTRINNPNAARYRFSFVYRFNLKDGQAVRQAKEANRN